MQVLPLQEPKIPANWQERQHLPGTSDYAGPSAPKDEPTETQINMNSAESIEFTQEEADA